MSRSFVALLLLLGFLYLEITLLPFVSFCNGEDSSSGVVCTEGERRALVNFKQGLTDPANRLSSWVEGEEEEDCCKWNGVVCNNRTGHVVKLDLRNQHEYNDSWSLGGEIYSSLLELKQLNYLDLSFNNFNQVQIPKFIGSLQRLTYLNLSHSWFGGTIPHELGNLSLLRTLDLSYLAWNINVDNIQWVSRLSSLRYLDMTDVDLQMVSVDLLRAANMLPSLRELRLKGCFLGNVSTASLPHVNFTSLVLLDLSNNRFSYSILDWVFNISNLVHLDLGGNEVGIVPTSPPHVNFKSLLYLDLSGNQFNSTIPNWLFDLSSSLVHLDLSSNLFRGSISRAFENMTSLAFLDLSVNELQSVEWGSASVLCNLSSLDLSLNQIKGEIQGIIRSLSRCVGNSLLEHLDLSSNQLHGFLPVELGEFKFLKNFDFSSNLVTGPIPASIGRLSFLKELRLVVGNKLNGTIPVSLGNLLSLIELDLSDHNFSGPIPDSFGRLSSLTKLDLRNNEFSGPIPTSLGNLSLLEELTLYNNSFSGSIPVSLGNLSSLTRLHLQNNQFSGAIPSSLSSLTFLAYLDLSSNLFSGPIPSQLGSLSSLVSLDFSNNKLNGTIPASLGQLSNLLSLKISNNSLEGVISEAHFANLTFMYSLDISLNSLALKVKSDWVPPFQLSFLGMSSCKLGPNFPTWLQTQKNDFDGLDLSNASISGDVPNWLWNQSIRFLDLSNNEISGKIPDLSNCFDLGSLFISSNHLDGPLPQMNPRIQELDLSNNKFSGPLAALSLCELVNLKFLDLSTNHLSGELPGCLNFSQEVIIMDLSNNNLSGILPSWICLMGQLKSLHLSNNKLQGEIPLCLENSTSLVTLDLGRNGFSGRIPAGIGKNISKLRILRLRSNILHGDIPRQLCYLSELHVLDLAANNLSGSLPWCLGNLSALVVRQRLNHDILDVANELFYAGELGSADKYEESIPLIVKGVERKYIKILSIVTTIDLSDNIFHGEIPQEITTLVELRMLNLSVNELEGKIPENIGNLGQLESLDLSRNHLSGSIPQSMSSINSLSYLNFSFNNLSGKIPSGNQLQTLNDPSCYIGNAKLCGPPLTEKCPKDETNQDPTLGSEKDNGGEADHGSEMFWFYISMAPGFVVGFWGICGFLLFKKSWRKAYFQFFDDIQERVLVTVAVNVARLRKKFERN